MHKSLKPNAGLPHYTFYYISKYSERFKFEKHIFNNLNTNFHMNYVSLSIQYNLIIENLVNIQ